MAEAAAAEAPAEVNSEKLAETAESFQSLNLQAVGDLTDATQLQQQGNATAGESTSTLGAVRVTAYFSRRAKPLTHHRPSASEMHWQKQPAVASQIHPSECFHFQALPFKAMPHTTQARWPESVAPGASDDRNHPYDFGYRQQRWKKHWAPAFSSLAHKEEDPKEIQLDDIVLLLTNRYGTLKAGCEKLDFFADGHLTGLEWQEGIFNLIATGRGPLFDQFRGLLVQRPIFNRRLQHLFRLIDKDSSGYITYEQLAETRGRPVDPGLPRSLEPTVPKKLKKIDTFERESIDRPASTGTLSRTEDSIGVSSSLNKFKNNASELARGFAAVLTDKFSSVDKAFLALDSNNSGELSAAEFVEGARNVIRFAGDAMTIFKELDAKTEGQIGLQEFRRLHALPPPQGNIADLTLQSKRDIAAARRLRSPVKDPEALKRGACLAASDIQLPMGERISGAAGFYSFSRSATGRLDDQVHPNEVPGIDHENYNEHHGPGTYEKGPGYHAETGCLSHPQRGNGWKAGGKWHTVHRFGPLVPSVEGQQDRHLSAAGFISKYEGRRPADQWKVNGTGATGPSTRSQRIDKSSGTESCFGLVPPKPIGRWEESRLTLTMKSRSEPTLLTIRV